MQCFHCGREVRETKHRPKSFTVDYYRLHTGKTEAAFFINPKENLPPLRYLRLTYPVDIVTCLDCYSIPQIRQKLDDDFRGVAPLIATPEGQDNNTSEAH